MKSKFTKITSFLLASGIVASTVVASAANLDYYHEESDFKDVKYSRRRVLADGVAKRHTMVKPKEFMQEFDGYLYDQEYTQELYEEHGSDWTDYLEKDKGIPLKEEDLTVESVSAINDIDSKTVKVTGTVTKDKEVEGKPVVVAELFTADKDGKFPEEGKKSDITLKEDGTFELVVVNVDAYKEGSYKVVVTATIGSGEEAIKATAEDTFEIEKTELEAIDKVVDAVNKATNQPALLKALQAEEFENVDPENIIAYEEALGAAPRNLKTVVEVQKIIDEVNSGASETELLQAIEKAVTDNNQIKLEELLKSAKLEVEVDGEKVAVEVKDGIIEDYEKALEEANDYSSLEKIATTIKEENERPLKEVNEATAAEGMKKALKDNADRLGLDLAEFNKLVTGRDTAALNDLIYNMKEQEDKKYTEETLKATFDEIVETRTVIQAAMKIYGEASPQKPLKDIEFITMVNENLKSVDYKLFNNTDIEEILEGADKKGGMLGLVERFNKLADEEITEEDADGKDVKVPAQAKVLKEMNYTGNSSFTEATTDFMDALEDVEALIAPEKARAEFEELAKKADALGLKEETSDSAYKAAKAEVDKTTGFNENNAKAALKTFEQVIDLNQAIKDKDAAAVEKALLALEVKYDDTNLYADLAKANRLEVAEELIEAEKVPIAKAEVSELAAVYKEYIEKIDNVNKDETNTNSAMQKALEAIVGEGKVTLEQAEAFLTNFPMTDAETPARVPYKTLEAIKADIK